MSFIYVADGIDDVLAAHLNQYADAWSGVAGKGQPFNAVAVNDPINFAISARNLDPTNSRAAQFLKADGTVLFQVDASGVKVSPDGTVASVPATVNSTQTLTNKTFTAPHMTSPVVDSGGIAVTGPVTFSGGVVIPNLSVSNATLGADAALTANTWTAVAQLTGVAAGSYLVWGYVTLTAAAQTQFEARLLDASNAVLASTNQLLDTANGSRDLFLVGVVTGMATGSIVLQAFANGAATAKANSPLNTQARATQLVVLRFN